MHKQRPVTRRMTSLAPSFISLSLLVNILSYAMQRRGHVLSAVVLFEMFFSLRANMQADPGAAPGAHDEPQTLATRARCLSPPLCPDLASMSRSSGIHALIVLIACDAPQIRRLDVVQPSLCVEAQGSSADEELGERRRRNHHRKLMRRPHGASRP
jgi:hypothetical protein